MDNEKLEAVCRDAASGKMSRREIKRIIPEAFRSLREVERLKVARQRDLDVLNDFVAWLENGHSKGIQRAVHPHLHKLVMALDQEEVTGIRDRWKTEGQAKAAEFLRQAHYFMVRHRWADAFGDAVEDFEFKLPYPFSAFEFQIDDRPVIVWVVQNGEDVAATGFVRSSTSWIVDDFDEDEPSSVSSVFTEAWRQIRAVCVALDSDIAETTVIRAPSRLNKRRMERRQEPIYDYHILHLDRRRVKPVGLTHHRSPRLHFRRGHWRHYDGFKTWIKWTLVGDPDMGFVDKDYAL